MKRDGIQRAGGILMSLVAFGVFSLGTGGCAAGAYPDPPRNIIDESVDKTVATAAKDGWIPCPGQCLKLATPGWQHLEIDGHPPTDHWMKWTYVESRGESWQAFSQNHIGHIIKVYPDKPAEDTGICPVCKGSGWVRKDGGK